MNPRQQKHETAAMFASVFLVLFILAMLFAFVAHCAEPVRREAAPPQNGGRISATITDDGKSIVQRWADGTVTTNVLKIANTPIAAVPVIESALRKQIIVDAALAIEEGNAETKLQLAAERASDSLRSKTDTRQVPDGGITTNQQPQTKGDLSNEKTLQ